MNAPDSFSPLPPETHAADGAAAAPLGGLDPRIEQRERRLRTMGIAAVLTLFVGLGGWSVLAPLDSAAIGPGVVVL